MSTQNQTDDVTVLPETVTDLDACACTEGSSSSSHLDFVHGGDEVDLSNCPAPADTITSGADPAADRNKESVAGFDLAKLCDYEFKIPQSKRDEAIRFGISQHPKHFPVDKAGIDFPVTVLKHTNRNGESYIRDYLSWSEQLQAFFCFPCRLFSTHDSFTKSSYINSCLCQMKT